MDEYEAPKFVRGDYQDGKLAADDWTEQRRQLLGELEAARAEAGRLRERERERHDARALSLDECVAAVRAIRAAVVGEVHDSGCLDAVRAALARLFDRFELAANSRP
jgi:hypothetical protein